MQLAKDAISTLIASSLEYDVMLPLLPNMVQVMCQSRRKQAETCINDLYSRGCDIAPVPGLQAPKLEVESVMAA